MICTIDINNGFRLDLLPRALSQTCEASLALRNAIFAVSCFHRFDAQKALPFKTKALRYLSYSLAGEEASRHPGVAETQFAASLMLCVYSVRKSLLLHFCVSCLPLIDYRYLTRPKEIGTFT